MSFNQLFESYVPVYDVVPEQWEEARPFLVEQLKKISNAVNIREIGWYLNEEVLSGKQFIPVSPPTSQYRSILRKTFEKAPVTLGINTVAHGINITSSFTLVNLYVAVTGSTTLTGQTVPSVSYTSSNIIFSTTSTWTRAVIVIEYMQEI